jgi:hypothetical protein
MSDDKIRTTRLIDLLRPPPPTPEDAAEAAAQRIMAAMREARANAR